MSRERRGAANSNWRGGKSTHPLIDIYYDMIGRCHRPTHKRYADYGGRGITVCDRWRNDFWAFVADMGERPDGLTLDRRNNDAGYSAENCRWATYSEQVNNRRPLPGSYTDADREVMRELYEGGLTYAQIGQRFSTHGTYVGQILRSLGIKGRPTAQILTPSQQAEICRLRASGLKQPVIASQFGVSQTLVSRTIRRARGDAA
jgi:DNA-binding CsgD family transcriptional regulator